MPTILHPVADPPSTFLLNSNLNTARFLSPVHHRDSQLRVQKSILCASNRRNRYGVGKTGKLVLESACIVASKMGILPEPLGLVLREFGSGNRGGNGPWKGFGWNGFDGWKRRRSRKLGVMGILVICGVVGMTGLVVGKRMALDAGASFGGLGLILFGVSVEGWRRGAKDWILGFCCCAFLVGLVLKKEDSQSRTMLGFFETLKKKVRRKIRAF